MKIHCQYTKLIPIDEIRFHEDNPNNHPIEQLTLLAKILEYQGWREAPRISNQTGKLIVGEGRVRAAKLNGWTEIPVSFQDYESEAQEFEDLVADNAATKLSTLDYAKINQEMLKYGPELNLEMLAIPDFELEPADKYEGKDAEATPEVRATDIKRGDLFALGSHRLLCGDSTERLDVDRLMNGEKADMVFTSPPYNAAKNSHLNGRVAGFDNKYKEHSDDLSDEDFLALLSQVTYNCLNHSNYVFVNLQILAHNRIPLMEYQYAFRNKLKDILIWNKSNCSPNIVKGAFNTRWEYIFCFSDDNKTRGFPCEWRGQYPNVVDGSANASNEFAGEHKAGFPVYLPIWLIEKMEFANSVWDPFMGTGSTLIACEKTNRKCYGMEIDPQYIDVIIRRWEKFSGGKAEIFLPDGRKAPWGDIEKERRQQKA